MKKFKYLFLASGLLVNLFSCKTNLKETAISKGDANFARYVAIGNSLTAGYADGALSRDGQINSYPNMLASQFALVGGGAFNVPYMNAGGGTDASGKPRRVLGYVIPCTSKTPTLSPVFDPLGATPLHNVSTGGPYNLIGVPGAKAIEATIPQYGMFNPFFGRFCQNPSNSSMLTEALRANPTFFTLWLGSNDVLLHALSGAANPLSAISDPLVVDATLTKMVDTLTKNGAKGAIANVPDITAIPYFTTVPWNGVVLDATKAGQLNALYASKGLSHITWTAGQNGFVIRDSAMTDSAKMRHATAEDFILLTTPGDSLSCGGWGSDPSKPLANQFVLDKREALNITAATIQYNSTIAGLASKYNLALVDIRSFLNSVKSGITYNGVTFNANFVSGGSFSLDGVHPTARGYAMIANEFIKSINAKYKSSIPLVNPLRFNGVVFP